MCGVASSINDSGASLTREMIVNSEIVEVSAGYPYTLKDAIKEKIFIPIIIITNRKEGKKTGIINFVPFFRFS